MTNSPKALIAWNPDTNAIRSGQVPSPPGFEPWMLKFDGVQDQSLGDSQGYGRIEHAYYRMALSAGIEMTECRLLEEGGRAHFMTRRFDRDKDQGKIHVQSFCALGHYDFNMAGAYGYEQAFDVIQLLHLGNKTLTQMYRRMVFNVLARNQDDHTRNTAFLMNHKGGWALSPAFDMMWAYNSTGVWTNQHQMSINDKRDNFVREDLLAIARLFGVKKPLDILQQVGEAVKRWPEFAQQSQVGEEQVRRITGTHRIFLT